MSIYFIIFYVINIRRATFGDEAVFMQNRFITACFFRFLFSESIWELVYAFDRSIVPTGVFMGTGAYAIYQVFAISGQLFGVWMYVFGIFVRKYMISCSRP